MAELADAHGSGPCGSNTMRVQVPLSALYMVAFHQYGETLFLYNRIKVSKDHTCSQGCILCTDRIVKVGF